jgi:hypothetical protein
MLLSVPVWLWQQGSDRLWRQCLPPLQWIEAHEFVGI